MIVYWKNYLLGLSNSCMQTYWYFIIILAGVFVVLFIQSRLQRLSDFVLYQFAKYKYPLPGRGSQTKSASQQVLFFIFLIISY